MTAPTMLQPAVGEMVTPTARLVLPAGVDRGEWLAARKVGIGASDAPVILDLDDFGTPRKVFYDKLGLLDDSAGDAAYFGNLFEGPIALEWAKRNRSVVEPIGLVAHKDDPVLLTTLDRRITECPLPETRREVCALEIKMRSAYKSARWSDGAPDDVMAQVLFQLAVTGYDHIHYAVLIGGNDYRQGVVRRANHEQTMRDVVAACRAWWDRYVVPQVVPPASVEHSDREIKMFKQMHPDPAGIVRLDHDDSVLGLLQDYETARLAEKAARQHKETAHAELLRLQGGAQYAYLNNDLAYSSELQDGRLGTNYERLAERWPEAYADCVKRGKPSRRLTIGSAFRLNSKES